MSTHQPVPAELKGLVDLSADVLGTFVLYATDDYFAEKENLLKPGAPQWLEGEYTSKGKWMDGWESQRKREPGHDFAIVRLGAPGGVRGALVDTTHFKGNAPQQIALEGIEAPYTATAAQLLEDSRWFPIIDQSAVKPDFPNVFTLEKASARVTHVRLRIYPDGGVARLRIYGDVLAEERTFWRSGSVDLGALENGGTIAAKSDEFFGPPANMLLPGRGVNMGDGWETKRRRTPGSDWAVVKLARRGILERVELDTHFFKGNAPQATLIEAVDASGLPAEVLQGLLSSASPSGWRVLVDKTALVQHRRHQLEPTYPMPVTHVRVHIFPHGGVNRLRLFGYALDTEAEATALKRLNALDEPALRTVLHSCCGSSAWVDGMMARRPFASVRALFAAAESVWWSLGAKDFLEAFAAHPRIGQNKKAAPQNEQSAEWSKGEQRAVAQANAETLERLAQLNDEYYEKFGFIFIVFATGKSAPEMLALLEQRMPREKTDEVETAAAEQAKITRVRLEKWLHEQMTGR
ncbi:MAG TPA: allantoicase [Archangium sp.]|nr:allantoicase [Archangium sp.]